MEILSRRLKELRLNSGCSRSVLADSLKVHYSAISLWERNVCEPTAPYIVAICRYFDVSSDYLLGLSDDL